MGISGIGAIAIGANGPRVILDHIVRLTPAKTLINSPGQPVAVTLTAVSSIGVMMRFFDVSTEPKGSLRGLAPLVHGG